jgi:hypothetical protein
MPTATQTAPKQPTAPYDENAVALTTKVMGAYLDAYEKASLGLADYQRDSAKATEVEWIATAGAAQADLTRQLTKAYVSAARDFVK